MHSYLASCIAIPLAYLCGSLSSAILVCKFMKLPDPRTQGSKNPGATNVLRFGGKKAAILTLVGDALKGVIPVLIAKALGFDDLSLCLITLGAFLGHLYPVFFQFQGGKGVATAAGCIFALNWEMGCALLATWFVVALCFRYSSLAALVATVCAPFYAWIWMRIDYVYLACVVSAFLVIRHANNIRNLLRGQESKIGSKKRLHNSLRGQRG